jgi:hypothetical protein
MGINMKKVTLISIVHEREVEGSFVEVIISAGKMEIMLQFAEDHTERFDLRFYQFFSIEDYDGDSYRNIHFFTSDPKCQQAALEMCMSWEQPR